MKQLPHPEPFPLDVINGLQEEKPEPWQEGEKIPWDEPGFSRRMLAEHLSQAHDAASRRTEIIDQHVSWLHYVQLANHPARVLDLACGPGLYTTRLAKLGHFCVGIDFSPASIEYALRQSELGDLACKYIQGDLRTVDFPDGFDLAMLLFGELNAFTQQDARKILKKARQALKENGSLVLEPHTFRAVQRIGEAPPHWRSQRSGLWSDGPYIYLQQNHWSEARQAATTRYFILENEPLTVRRYAASMQAYSRMEYERLLTGAGFQKIRFWDGFSGRPGNPEADLYLITAACA